MTEFFGDKMFDGEDLLYSKEHEWVFVDDNEVAWVGITQYAITKLGDIVYLDLPSEDTTVAPGECVGEVESTKSVSEIYSPVAGTVISVNEDAVSSPNILNSDSPVWLFKVELDETPDLMDFAQYTAYTQE